MTLQRAIPQGVQRPWAVELNKKCFVHIEIAFGIKQRDFAVL